MFTLVIFVCCKNAQHHFISVHVSLRRSNAGAVAEAASRRPGTEGPEQDRRRLQLRLRGERR